MTSSVVSLLFLDCHRKIYNDLPNRQIRLLTVRKRVFMINLLNNFDIPITPFSFSLSDLRSLKFREDGRKDDPGY